MAHAGTANGELIATYDQLESWGIARRFIASTISEAERLGLIVVEYGARRGYAKRYLSKYRLTFYATRKSDEFGRQVAVASTDDWRRYVAPPRRSRKNRNSAEPAQVRQPQKILSLRVIGGNAA